MNIRNVIFISMFFWSFFARAQFDPFDRTCTPRDFRAALGPPRDQGDLGWCFAYSAADLITQRLGVVISAADLATSFHLNDAAKLAGLQNPAVQNYLRLHPDFMKRLRQTRAEGAGKLDPKNVLTIKGLADSGGDEEMTLLLANINGICEERQFPSTENFVGALLRDAWQLHDAQSRRQGSPVMREQNDSTSAVRDPISVAMTDYFHANDNRLCSQRRYSPFPLIPYNVHVADSIEDYRQGLQTGRYHVTREGYAMVAEIHRALDSGRIAAIGYGTDAVMPKDGSSDDHSSVIVARKNINGTCRYYIRNTWGSDCSIYLPEYRETCENGGVWLTTTELARTVYAVTVLE